MGRLLYKAALQLRFVSPFFDVRFADCQHMTSCKKNIGGLLSTAPEGLQDLGKVDFIHLDGSRPAYWAAGIGDVLKNAADL